MPLTTGKTIGNVASGAAQGAMIGSVIPGLGTVAGAAIGGGVQLLSSLFSRDPEEERRSRYAAYLEKVRELRTRALEDLETGTTTSLRRIGTQTVGLAGQDRAAAARRAIALGRSADAESFILPSQQKIYEQGSLATQNLLEGAERRRSDINQRYLNAELDAEAGFQDRPIEPTLSDTLAEIGGAVAEWAPRYQMVKNQEVFNDRYGKWLEDYRNALTATDQNNATAQMVPNAIIVPNPNRSSILTVPSSIE
jgi:hypothetical protein